MNIVASHSCLKGDIFIDLNLRNGSCDISGEEFNLLMVCSSTITIEKDS
jgi:hypothetical protein